MTVHQGIVELVFIVVPVIAIGWALANKERRES